MIGRAPHACAVLMERYKGIMEALIDILPVRLPEPSHRAALLELLDHYARDPMGGGQSLSAFTREHLIASLRSRSDYVGLLAWQGCAPVGLLNAFEGFSTFAARPLLNIHDLVVRREQRGRGIGARLLQAVELEAEKRGCCKLTLEVLSANTVAQRSYARAGFAGYQLDPSAGQALFFEKKLA